MPPRLDDNDAIAAYAALLRRIPAYVPGWHPRDGSPETALLRIVARYREVLNERLNAAPEKKTLYIVGGGAVWKVAMVAQGIQGRAK